MYTSTHLSNRRLVHGCIPALKEGLAWLKLKPVPEELKSPVAVLGATVAAVPNRLPVLAAIGLEGPFLPAW